MDREAFRERFGILGDSDGMRRVVDRIRQVARTEITVLLEGESGVGKELLAQAVHALSSRRHKSLVVVNCGAIPEGLIESELFGAEKGAYTGATSQRTGFFEEANGGTIFLDEIGEMPTQAQVRLLRVLETGQFSRVGSSQVQTTNARVVAATNKNLAESVRRGDFREDLYYRLSTVVIQIPSLRERREDILPLFDHFLHRFTQQYNAQTRRLSDEARELLVRYNWPGNVRELRNVAEQAVVLVPGTRVDADTLRPLLRGLP
ncbi:MAG: sigma-54 dependent transcriptional regulator [Bacteroidota bacterium]